MRYLMLFLSLSIAATVCLGKDLPILSERVVSNEDIFFSIQQFSPMLPMNDGSVLIFRNSHVNLQILRLWPDASQKQALETVEGFTTPYHTRQGRPDSGQFAKYASARTSAGVWLIGATIELLRPNKTRQTGKLNKPRNAPEVVALPDGSILVAGSEEWHAVIPERFDNNAPDQRTVERVSIDGDGRIVSEYVAPVPSCRPHQCHYENLGKFAMLHIGEGRVMFAGGGGPNTYIYDSTTRSWRKSMAMREERSNFSLTLLPDGRVLAAGGNESISNRSNRGMTTEIWDPKTEQWSVGPKLPMPMLEHKSVLAENKTVILAGGRFAGVLAWEIDKPQWRIAATLTNARARAGVVYLKNGRLAILGGLHANNYDEGWGRRTEGYSIVGIPPDVTRSGKPAGLTAINHAVAVRGTQTIVAGGMLTSTFDGSVHNVPTSNVELFNSSNNTVRGLPPLPFGAKSAKAFWLDDHRVLIMALEDDGYHTPLWADLFDITSETHNTIKLPTNIGNSSMSSQEFFDNLKLAGTHANHVFLVFGSNYLASLDFSNSTFSPGYYIPRSNFSLSVLKNGKVVVAGGTGSHMILSRVANCERCPETYVEYGSILPLSTYEIFDPIEQKTVTSALSMAFGGPLTIFADGRVAKLGIVTELAKYSADTNSSAKKTSMLLELSNTAGTAWHVLSLPPALRSKKSIDGERLLSVKNAGGLLDSVLLIGVPDGSANLEWWWIDLSSATPDWQQLGLLHSPSILRPDKTNLGQLKIAGYTFTLIEGDDGITAFDE